MKKLPKYLSTFALALVVWGAFSVPNALAQSGTIITGNNIQNVISSPVSGGTGIDFSFKVGNSILSGSSTAMAVVASSTNTSGFANQEVFRINVDGYTDATYTSNVQSCSYEKTANAPFSISGVIELPYRGGDCVFLSTRYYKITFTHGAAGYVTVQYYGANISKAGYVTVVNNTDIGIPAFAIYAQIQSIDPNLVNGGNPSGISTSTVASYCNQSTATTSTGVLSEIGSGFSFAICYALGFAFIPDQNTLRNFQDLVDNAKTKIPFSYGYDIAGVFSNMSASSSQNFPTYSIGLSALDFSSSTAMGPIFPSSLDFLSSTTINRFLPSGMHDLLYNFAIFVIWVEVAFVIYRKVVPTKAKI